MLACERYTYFDADLTAERRRATELFRLFNVTEDAAKPRESSNSCWATSVRSRSSSRPSTVPTVGTPTSATYVVSELVVAILLDNNEVHIGDHVMVGPFVQIYTAAHPLEAEAGTRGWEVAKPVVIGRTTSGSGAAPSCCRG